MIIGIDISSIPYGTGVSNYTLNLVRNLIKIDKKNTYKLFFSSLRRPFPEDLLYLKKYQNVKFFHYKFPLTLLEIIWNRLRIFPIELFIGPCDVFHTSDWTQPPTLKAKTISTVHDLTPFTHPQWHVSKTIQAHSNKMYWATKKCFKFVCVSENTKNDLLKIFPLIDPKKICVIYEAAEDKYSKFLKLPLTVQKNKIETIKKQYGLSSFILAQGTREPRKNLNKLIEAFHLFKNKYPNSKIELAIAGKYGWGKDIKQTKNNSIKILGFIPEKNMVPLHASAFCLAYPSLYEGFGLPLVKAMQVGIPIITSNNSSLKEITKNCALLVNPNSAQDIAKSLEKIYKYGYLRKNLINKGLEQGHNFSWEKTAQKTLEIYEKLSS